jgi:acyl-coenzyme A thioesterase 9
VSHGFGGGSGSGSTLARVPSSPWNATTLRSSFSSSSSSSKSESTGNNNDGNNDSQEMAGLFKNPIVQQLWKAREQAKKLAAIEAARSHKAKGGGRRRKDSAQQPQVPKGKSPQDSQVSVTYQFSTDTYLREAYRNPWGQMRLGRLMEDLDALAGNIAYFHVSPSPSNLTSEQGGAVEPIDAAAPGLETSESVVVDFEEEEEHHHHPIIVTASVDRIQLKRPSPDMARDQELSGCVTWTGTSSMEIRMQCLVKNEHEPWLVAYVTFVTLHPITKRPMPISPVVPSRPLEQKRYDAGARRAVLKKQRRQRKGLGREGSGRDEALEDLAESLLREAGPLLTLPSLADPHSILMTQTKMQNAQIAQPQVQNLHRRIFGGFLLRRAFELGFANAYLFGGALPLFLEVDEVSFQSPVDVGDLLVFNSRVLYTEPGGADLGTYYVQQQPPHSNQESSPPVKLPIVHVEVECWVTEPEKAQARLSNQFYFTFAVRSSSSTSSATKSDRDDNVTSSNPPPPPLVLPPIRKVLPSNIDEARRMASRILGDQEQHDHRGAGKAG